MGHANIAITFDHYGHLMPGNEAEAAQLLTAYLAKRRARADDQARTAHVGELLHADEINPQAAAG